MAWLLDTNILSEIRRSKPEARVLGFIAGSPLSELYVSVVTLAELRFGIEGLSLGSERRRELENWLAQTMRPMFEQRVLQVTENVMLRWRVLMEGDRKTGHTFSQPDLIIGATALEHRFTVVSRDRSDCDKARVPVFNPWEQP
jgi:toxin FitB